MLEAKVHAIETMSYSKSRGGFWHIPFLSVGTSGTSHSCQLQDLEHRIPVCCRIWNFAFLSDVACFLRMTCYSQESHFRKIRAYGRLVRWKILDELINRKVFYDQEPPSGESTTTECGVNYQRLAIMYRRSPMRNS